MNKCNVHLCMYSLNVSKLYSQNVISESGDSTDFDSIQISINDIKTWYASLPLRRSSIYIVLLSLWATSYHIGH